MPPAVIPEARDDARRVLGADILMRTCWAGDRSVVYQVFRDRRTVAYLKVAPSLLPERERLAWLRDRLPVPEVLSFGSCPSGEWLVLSPLPGLELSSLKHTAPAEQIIASLSDALHAVHATDAAGCPFESAAPGPILTHGDACLPNFLFEGQRLTGVLDVGEAGRGVAVADLATAVWSLQFNLGPGHAKRFLDEYGFDLSGGEFVLAIDDDGKEALLHSQDARGIRT